MLASTSFLMPFTQPSVDLFCSSQLQLQLVLFGLSVFGNVILFAVHAPGPVEVFVFLLFIVCIGSTAGIIFIEFFSIVFGSGARMEGEEGGTKGDVINILEQLGGSGSTIV